MKSKKLKMFGAACVAILLVLAFVSFVIVGRVCVLGYSMYKEAVAKISIENKIEEIKNSENFVSISDIPESFLNAIVSVEDHRFYHHNGFDIVSIVRAATSNLLNEGTVSGGSTITQQLAKNMYFSFEKTYTRKFAELLVALQLEEKLDKTEILELYVNIIYFGNDSYGVGEATEAYFGKKPQDISLEEAVLLAGIPKAPSVYDISTHNDKALKRADQVICAMVENRYIDSKQADKVSQNIYSSYGTAQAA